MIEVVDSQLQILKRPVVRPMLPGTNSEQLGQVRFSLLDPIVALGTVTFSGAASDHMMGWTVGFIQVETAERNRARYHSDLDPTGPYDEDRGAAAGVPAAPVMDVVNPNFSPWHQAPGVTVPWLLGQGLIPARWAAGLPAHPFTQQQFQPRPKFPLQVQILFMDAPAEDYPLLRRNLATGVDKRLREARVEMEFTTSLVVRNPAGQYRFLKSFDWGVYWNNRFDEYGAALPRNLLPAPWNAPGAPAAFRVQATPIDKGNHTVTGTVRDEPQIRWPFLNNVASRMLALPVRVTAISRAGQAAAPPGYQ